MEEKVWVTSLAHTADADAILDEPNSIWDALNNPSIVAISKNRPEPEDLEYVGRKYLEQFYDSPVPSYEKVREPNAVAFIFEDGSQLNVQAIEVPLATNLLFAKLNI